MSMLLRFRHACFVTILALFCLILAGAIYAPCFADQVTLAWDAGDPAPDGYRVYKRTADTAYDYSDPAWSGEETTCTLYDLSVGVQYYFVVRAYVGTFESGDSNEVAFLLEDTGQSEGDGTDPGQNDPGDAEPPVTVSSTIVSSCGANGSISPSGSLAITQGNDQTYAIQAETGFHIADVLVDDVSMGPISEYTFQDVSGDHTIYAAFAPDDFTISASTDGHGVISPSGDRTVSYGGSQTYDILPDTGYVISDVIVDGVSVSVLSEYTFSSIDSNHTIEAVFITDNKPPIADAGPDQTVDEATQVTLSGLNSMDPDDGIASFQWRQLQGPSVIADSVSDDQVLFIAPNVDEQGQSLVFELTVTDYSGVSSVDTCIVNVSWVNAAPVAHAGNDQTVYGGETVFLNGSNSYDSDNGITDYQWVQRQGPEVTLSASGDMQPSFIAPDVDDGGASLVFELTVTDADGLQDTDTCVVTVAWENQPPVADAGPDFEVISGDQVTLDGSLSTDPDDGILGYQWKQTEGLPVSLSDSTALSPVFTAPEVDEDGAVLTFELIVTDVHGLQSTDNCQVFIQAQVGSTELEADTTAPELAITDPYGSFVLVRQRIINIQGSTSDNVAVDQVVWENNSRGSSGVASLESDGSWEIKNLLLSSWFNTITITAYDTNGNSQSATLVVLSWSRR